MPWKYKQSTGVMYKPDGTIFRSELFAGRGDHKNKSASECVLNFGPIPRGLWNMVEWIPHHPTAGPKVIRLQPQPDTVVCGRSGFLIHGGGSNSSQGCIILNGANYRKEMWDSTDHVVQVVQ